MKTQLRLAALSLTAGAFITASAWADPFFFTAGNADGRLGALSQGERGGRVETETADDFVLTQTTVINGATIIGLVLDDSVADITNVEIEVYHKFPEDPRDDTARTPQVPSRVNSPSDHEIDSATRDSGDGTLIFSYSSLNSNFSVGQTVIDKINPSPNNRTLGEGPASGEEVQITIRFANPIVLPAGHYFFRPEVHVTSGDFLYLSSSRPMVSPTPITPDLQAWIRNAHLTPDWLRIGTDIIDAAGATAPTFNMTFSLSGNTIPAAGIPGDPECHGETIAGMANQFGGTKSAASILGFSSVSALQDSFREFCNP